MRETENKGPGNKKTGKRNRPKEKTVQGLWILVPNVGILHSGHMGKQEGKAMQDVVMPTCPYCGQTMRKQMNDEDHPLRGITKDGGSRLVKCERCKERYYAQKQTRFIGRRNL